MAGYPASRKAGTSLVLIVYLAPTKKAGSDFLHCLQVPVIVVSVTELPGHEYGTGTGTFHNQRTAA